MNRLHRARLFLLVAAGLSAALLATQLPLSELVGQRRELAVATQQLQVLDQRNAQLRAENAALRQPSTVAAIAHADYGLVRPGQRAYVILPGRSASAGSLAAPRLPRSDLLSGSAAALTGVGAPPAALTAAGAPAGSPGQAGSFWSRTLTALEFWRWAF